MSKSNVTPVMDANVRSKLCEYLRLRRRSEALALPAWLEMDHNRDLSRMIHPYEAQKFTAQEAHETAKRATEAAMAVYVELRDRARASAVSA